MDLGSSVSILSDYRLYDQATGVWSLAEARNFSSSLCVQTNTELHPASYPMGTGVLAQGVKRGRAVTLAVHSHLVPR
jgi:hypothetical protein